MSAGILALVKQPVLSSKVEVSGSTANNHTDRSSQIDRKSQNESRSVFTVQVRSPDVRGVAQGVNQSVYNGSLDVWSGNRRGDPGENDNGRGVEG